MIIGIALLMSVLAFAAFPIFAASTSSCTCSDGRSLEAGAVRYSRNSDREVITRVEPEADGARNVCAGVWITDTEIHTRGTPYNFYLQRTTGRERRVDGCGDSSDRFVKRARTYEFVFDADSTSIREMRPIGSLPVAQSPDGDAQPKSNANLWDIISSEDLPHVRRAQSHVLKIDSAREFNRTSWVFSRKDIQAHDVGIVKDAGQNETLITLKKTRKVKAGQLGQIEAVDSRRAIVRFYLGSRIARFAKAQNAIRRWYDDIGGPYKETKDDLYTPIRAYIVEVSLDDIIEVNNYLDQLKTDRTRPLGL